MVGASGLGLGFSFFFERLFPSGFRVWGLGFRAQGSDA